LSLQVFVQFKKAAKVNLSSRAERGCGRTTSELPLQVSIARCWHGRGEGIIPVGNGFGLLTLLDKMEIDGRRYLCIGLLFYRPTACRGEI
jgi:hypothetical protein